MIGVRYFPYWGKARPIDGGADLHLLIYHALDVAAVGYVYLETAPSLLRWLAKQLGTEDTAAVRQWVTFWFSLHDLGKFSISFQGQRPDLVARLQGSAPEDAGPSGIRHDSLGMKLWTDRFVQIAEREAWFGGSVDVFDGVDYWVAAVTGHHGQPPLSQVTHLDRYFRDIDREAALQFTLAMKEQFLTPAAVGIPELLDPELFARRSAELSWWISGLAVLADWIGSNAELFCYCDQADRTPAQYWTSALQIARRALQQTGVLPPIRSEEKSFQELFPAIQQASPLQKWAQMVPIDACPQVYLLEDVTGAGKTEAAVDLAHRLMARGCADGFFIGLPTMATANAMYGRIASLYRALFGSQASLILAHSHKRLVDDFEKSVWQPGIDEHDDRQADESATRRCTRWLADHNKRALLAPAGIGTIDQALLAVLQSKHQSLRLFGLMRKVLLVDEVHACDPYMRRTLEILLEFHARAGGSAILLSATMTREMKSGFIAAFAKGSQSGRCAPKVQSDDFPLATVWRSEKPGELAESPVATRADVQRTVAVRYLCDRDDVLKGIVRAMEGGSCVAWIRNTVADALEAWELLKARIPPNRITLFHARFTLGDRLDRESEVLDCFGPTSTAEQRQGRLLIATQVAEQSLDIDLDLLVSDLAPIDRLIQRSGRLHRHRRGAAGDRIIGGGGLDSRAAPCLWVYGPRWVAEPPPNWFRQFFPRASQVYPNHGQLWLTAGALRAGLFTMPD